MHSACQSATMSEWLAAEFKWDRVKPAFRGRSRRSHELNASKSMKQFAAAACSSYKKVLAPCIRFNERCAALAARVAILADLSDGAQGDAPNLISRFDTIWFAGRAS